VVTLRIDTNHGRGARSAIKQNDLGEDPAKAGRPQKRRDARSQYRHKNQDVNSYGAYLRQRIRYLPKV